MTKEINSIEASKTYFPVRNKKAGAYGVYSIVRFKDGTERGMSTVWLTSDIRGKSPRQVSKLIQGLVQNTINNLIEDQSV